MNTIKILKETKNPDVLVVTPLLPEHEVSKITKKTIKRNDIPFYWISSAGNNNIPINAQEGIDWFKKSFGKLPPYYIMIDRDIEMGRHMIDRLFLTLQKALRKYPNIAYSYASFEFKGDVKAKFPARPWNINRLVRANYISSNSLFKSSVIEEIGLVKDDKYVRLLDYAFLLKCFGKGNYIGVPEPTAWFIAHSTKDDISARSKEDYKQKYDAVFADFIQPLIDDEVDRKKYLAVYDDFIKPIIKKA